MKINTLFLTMALLLAALCAVAMDTVENPAKCKHCGMDRTIFAQSRMLVEYADGTAAGVCSLHCAALEQLHNRDRQIRSIKVADYSTKKLLDAKAAVWVVGGKKAGVMTAVAKWAFARNEDAQRYVAEYGGVVNSFEQAMNSATQEVMDQTAEEKKVEEEMFRELKR
jgi:nitrous oxide reductase accessory protein NosL